jgi:hypothetical protein
MNTLADTITYGDRAIDDIGVLQKEVGRQCYCFDKMSISLLGGR